MKKLLLLIAFFAGTACFAQADEPTQEQNYIEVSATGEIEFEPDEIYIKIIIDEDDLEKDMKVADAEKLMINKLKLIGINPEEDLVIKDMVSNFKDNWFTDDEIEEQKEYELKLKTAEETGKFFTEMKKIGLSNLYISLLDHSNPDSLIVVAKEKAMENAKVQAKALAASVGKEIGEAIYISTDMGQYSAMRAINYSSGAGIYNTGISISSSDRGIGSGRKSEPVRLSFQKNSISASVKVRFVLK
jgi:uncharacterized protein YggE